MLGPLSVQPGEFVKIMIAGFFAGYLTVNRDAPVLSGRRVLGMRLPPGRRLGPIAAIWAPSASCSPPQWPAPWCSRCSSSRGASRG